MDSQSSRLGAPHHPNSLGGQGGYVLYSASRTGECHFVIAGIKILPGNAAAASLALAFPARRGLVLAVVAVIPLSILPGPQVPGPRSNEWGPGLRPCWPRADQHYRPGDRPRPRTATPSGGASKTPTGSYGCHGRALSPA